jgi:hypothetical protein
MHRYRITFLGGLAAGFILGTRAGRERYEQLKRFGRRVADNPAVQQAAGAVQAQAAGMAKAAQHKVSDELHERVPKLAGTARDKVGEHIPGMRHRNGSSRHPSANGSTQDADGRPMAATGSQDGTSD